MTISLNNGKKLLLSKVLKNSLNKLMLIFKTSSKKSRKDIFKSDNKLSKNVKSSWIKMIKETDKILHISPYYNKIKS